MRLEQEGFNPGRNRYFKCFYEINLVPGPDNVWAVRAKWGKLGTDSPRTEIKASGSFEECAKVYYRLLNKRIKNGYTKVEENTE
jgi:predicted DNA-binding WGR domain protein